MAASNDIHLKVTGTFVDNLSKKASAAMKSVSDAAGRVGRACNGVASALSTFGGKAESMLGKISSGVGNMVGAFMTMGPVGALIAGVSLGFEVLTRKMTAAADAAKKLADEFARQVRERHASVIAEAVEEMNEGLKETVSDADRAAKSIDALATSVAKVAAAYADTAVAQNQLAIANLRGERQAAMNAAGSADERATVGAAYDVQIAQTQLAQVAQEQAEKVRAATAAQETAYKKFVAAINAESALRDEVAKAEAELAQQSGVDAEFDKELRKRRDAAVAAYERASAARDAAEDAVTVAQQKVEQAELARSTAVRNATTAVDAATQAEKNLAASLKAAQEKRIKAEEEAALAAQKKDLQEQLKEAEDRGRDAAGAAKEANAEVAAAQEKFDANINANLANARNNAKIAGRGSNLVTFAQTAAEAAAEQAAAAQVAVNQGIANGTIRNMAQLQSAQKAAARANRDYNSSKEANQEKRDAAEYERLSNMSAKSMSQWQKNRLANLQKLKDAKDKDANDLAAAKAKADKAQQAQIDAAEDIKDIKAKLKELGLK